MRNSHSTGLSHLPPSFHNNPAPLPGNVLGNSNTQDNLDVVPSYSPPSASANIPVLIESIGQSSPNPAHVDDIEAIPTPQDAPVANGPLTQDELIAAGEIPSNIQDLIDASFREADDEEDIYGDDSRDVTELSETEDLDEADDVEEVSRTEHSEFETLVQFAQTLSVTLSQIIALCLRLLRHGAEASAYLVQILVPFILFGIQMIIQFVQLIWPGSGSQYAQIFIWALMASLLFSYRNHMMAFGRSALSFLSFIIGNLWPYISRIATGAREVFDQIQSTMLFIFVLAYLFNLVKEWFL